MIEPQLVERVEQLLAEDKLSHRKIARITGVSRGTIGAIASGRRRIRPKPMAFGKIMRWSRTRRPSDVRSAGAWCICPVWRAARERKWKNRRTCGRSSERMHASRSSC